MKILFITPWFPTPPVNGSKIRIFNLMKAMASVHQVDLISFIREGELIDEKTASKYCRVISTIPYKEFRRGSLQAWLGFFSKKPRSLVDSHNYEFELAIKHQLNIEPYNIVIFSQLTTATYCPRNISIPTIFEEVESGIFVDNYLNATGTPSRFRHHLTWIKYRNYISNLLNRFTSATVVSRIEKEILQSVSVPEKIKILPNAVDTTYYHPAGLTPFPNRIIYTGAMTYEANLDAMRYFTKEILPLIRDKVPNIQILITGSTKYADTHDLERVPNVLFTGFVEDIRPLIETAWLSIVPLGKGGGTRLKILESMAIGTPVISTSKGAEGLAITPEKDIIIADKPNVFAQQTLRLLKDPDRRKNLANNGLKLIEKIYNWDKIGLQFLEIINNANNQ